MHFLVDIHVSFPAGFASRHTKNMDGIDRTLRSIGATVTNYEDSDIYYSVDSKHSPRVINGMLQRYTINDEIECESCIAGMSSMGYFGLVKSK